MAEIHTSNSNTLVSGTSSNDSIRSYKGDYVTISGGNGDDIVANYKCDYVSIDGGKGSDYIYDHYCDYMTILGGLGKDTISNYISRSIKIYGEEGNDSLSSSGGYNITISGGKGNDYISSNEESMVSLSGDAGNDSIYTRKVVSSTINGGKGNDFIGLVFYNEESENINIEYASGDGNDTIYGFNSTDILHITKGSYKVKTSGNDVIVTVGKGKIILEDAVGKSIRIMNSKGKVTTKTYGSSSAQTAELFAENNFATSDNLSEIVKNDLTATDYKLETQNFDSLTQKNNLITFAEK